MASFPAFSMFFKIIHSILHMTKLVKAMPNGTNQEKSWHDFDENLRVCKGPNVLKNSGFIDELQNYQTIKTVRVIGTLGIYRAPFPFSYEDYEEYVQVFTKDTPNPEILKVLKRIQALLPLDEILPEKEMGEETLSQLSDDEKDRLFMDFLKKVNVVQFLRFLSILNALVESAKAQNFDLKPFLDERLKIITNARKIPISVAIITRIPRDDDKNHVIFLDAFDTGYYTKSEDLEMHGVQEFKNYFFRIRDDSHVVRHLIRWFDYLFGSLNEKGDPEVHSVMDEIVLKELTLYVMIITMFLIRMRSKNGQLPKPQEYDEKDWKVLTKLLNDAQNEIVEMIQNINDNLLKSSNLKDLLRPFQPINGDYRPLNPPQSSLTVDYIDLTSFNRLKTLLEKSLKNVQSG